MREVFDVAQVGGLRVAEEEHVEALRLGPFDEREVDRFRQRAGRLHGGVLEPGRTGRLVDVVEAGQVQLVDRGHPVAGLDDEEDVVIVHHEPVNAFLIRQNYVAAIRDSDARDPLLDAIADAIAVGIVEDHAGGGDRGAGFVGGNRCRWAGCGGGQGRERTCQAGNKAPKGHDRSSLSDRVQCRVGL